MMLQKQTENQTKTFSLTQQYQKYQKENEDKQKRLNLQI